MKRRILALLLTLVMLVGMIPTSVFADEAAQETISAPVEEVEAPVLETEAPQTQPPVTEAPVTEAPETQAPTQAPETEAPATEAPETQAPETQAPTEEALDVMEENTPADPVTVYFTVSDQGVLAKTSSGKAAVELPVTVNDADEDGILTFHDALVALHEAYRAEGYTLQKGGTVAKLWGVETNATSFFKNGEELTKMVDYKTSTVEDNDQLYAVVMTDKTDRADCFTWFTETKATVEVGKSLKLQLMGKSNDYTKAGAASIPVGTWEKGVFTQIGNTCTDYDGNVTLSFDKVGTYLVTAKGVLTGSRYDYDLDYDDDIDCPTIAPYCVVTVEEAVKPGATVYFTMSADGVIATSSNGDAMADKPVTVKDLNGDGVLTVDEALKAAHEAYCPGGYESSAGTYGTGYVTKLWGVANKGYLFYVDNVPLFEGVQSSSSKVEEGSHLYASILQDEKHWADWYTYFDKTTATVEAYSDLTLKLSGFLGMSQSKPTASAVSGVSVGTWVDGKFKVIDGLTTDKDGTVTVSFEEAGTYVITANGTVHDKVTDYGSTEAVDWDCPIMAPYCVVTVTPAQFVTATVSYSGQAEGDFVTLGVDTEVRSNLAESYGYKDQVDASTAVSALDVLVQAHLNCFGVDFTKAEARTYLDVSDTGAINTMFCVESSNLCYLVNGTTPGSKMVNQCKVENGDNVLFAFFQDTTGYSDQYTYLAGADGKALDGQTLEAGKKYTLTVMGKALYGGTDGPVSGAKVYLVDTENGALDTTLGTTGSDGKCTVTVPADWAGKTVCLTAKGTNTFMSLARVTVTKVTTVSVSIASWLYDCYLENLYPHENVTVSSNLAESYGYKDGISAEDGVSVLDVLVKAHQIAYGDSFTPEKAESYLTVNNGAVTTAFGNSDEDYFRTLINGKAADSLVDKSEVKSGDSVFFAYLNEEPENVRIAYLTTADGKNLDGQSFSVDGYSQLVLMGTPLEGGDAEPISDGLVNILDLATGKETGFGESDSNGILRIHWPESAANQTICLAVYGSGIDLPTVSKITVDTKNAPNYLDSLKIAIGKDENSLTPVTFTPFFFPGTFDYTTPILDYVADSSARYVWAKVTATDGTTVSCKTGPYFWDNTTLESGKWTKLLSLDTGRYNKVTLTLTKDGTNGNAYTITLPMQPDTSKQTLTWKTDLKSLVYFRPNAEATLTVLAQHNNKPLDSKAEITYQWYYMASPDGEPAIINDATGPSFSPKTDEKGYSYYYVIASCDGVESIRSKTIAVKVTDEKAPTSITLTCDYPYYVEDTWIKALDGKKFIATKGDQMHIRAIDENGNDTPVEWSVNTYGSAAFDPNTGLYTVNYAGNGYITVSSLIDPSIKSEEKAVQTADYKFSDYNRNQTVTLSTDGQGSSSATLTGGVNEHNIWTLDIPERVGTCEDDISKKPGSISIKLYRPGKVTATVTVDLGGENDPKLTDTATITVNGVGVETTDGTRTRLDLEMTAKVPNPTASLTAYLMEGRTVASWTSSNEDVATVDDKGVVTAKGIGSAIITATDSEGNKGGIKVVVADAAKPTLESFAFSSGWRFGVNGLTFHSTTFDYTGLSLASATSKLEVANTTVYSDKLEAVATYVDEKGVQQTVAIPSGTATNLLPNIAFGTNKLTVTLSRKDNKNVKSVYTFEITRPRDASNPLLKAQGGMTLLAADGSNLGTDLYKGKVEGFLFKADADGNYVGGNGAFYNNTYLYRAYMQNGRKDFTLSATANVAYSHLRYSTDNGQTWMELPQGGGRTAVISFPEPTTGNAEVKVILQLVSDKVYADSGNTFPETVTHSQNGIVYTVWVEQIPSAEDLQMLTASTEIGYWYPAFDPDHSDYTVSIPNGAEAPELRYTVKAGLTVTLNGVQQVPDETGTYTLALSNKDRQTLTLSSAGGDVQRTYSFRSAQHRVNTADTVLDHLAINSQYTNNSYAVYPEKVLEDTTSSLTSLGNFGGYITFYFEDGLTNDDSHPYGVDFYIDGNAFVDTFTGTGLGSMEPGQVWVSEDGNTWYALAGSEHYDGAIWDYTVTYTRDGNGTHWSDNYGNTDLSSYGRSFQWPIASAYPLNSLVKNDTITLSGILIPSNKGIVGNDDFGTTSSGARFGYVDVLPSGRNNPYLDNEDYKNESSGFDLAWAVDASGNPVDVNGKSFHYVKVVTASNIIAGAANEKSTEVNGIFRAESTGSDVGTTAAPTAITFSGNGITYSITPEEGKQIYELVLPMNAPTIQVEGGAENIYVNNQRIASDAASRAIDITKDNTLVRVIVQSGAMEPTIYLLKLSYRDITGEVTEGTSTTLIGGKSMKLTAVDRETGKTIPASSITWALENPDDAAYATVTAAGVVKSYVVASKHDVTFLGALKNGYSGFVKHTITIYPPVSLVEIHSGDKNVTGETLYLNGTEGAELALTAKLYPTDGKEGVTWKSSNTKVLTVEDGTVRYVAGTGTVTVTATANDGSKKSASVKVQVGLLTQSVTITEPETTVLRSGKSLTLKAATEPVKPTVSGVTFRLVNASDSVYATVAANGKVAAKTVNEPHAVQVVAASKDGQAKSEPITLTILPKSNQTLILKSGTDYVTKTTLVRNVGSTVTLEAYTLNGTDEIPAENVTWKSSKTKVATVDETGKIECLAKGKATISALVDGKVQATVTVSVTTLVESLTIGSKTGTFTLASGKKLNLTATAAPAEAANKAVTWAITEGSEYAKVSGSGVVTANKNLTVPVTVTVQAAAKDGSGVTAQQDITVNPLSYGVEIKRPNASENTTLVWDMADRNVIRLSAKVYPLSAEQSVTWKSSNARVASIDASGKITCLKAGTVTITATANDGSGKKASFKLQIVKLMKFLGLVDVSVAGGKSVTLKPVIGPADTTNKKLAWSVSENKYGIKINGSGKVSTKAVTEPVNVTVTVSALDGSGVSASCEVTVYPATTKVTIDGKLPASISVDTTLELTASSLPENTANVYTWKSSNTKVATVDENGVVTAHKAGTVKITCTAADGTNKSASVTLKVVEAIETPPKK